MSTGVHAGVVKISTVCTNKSAISRMFPVSDPRRKENVSEPTLCKATKTPLYMQREANRRKNRVARAARKANR
jgi:hypothetical protein